MDALFRIGLVKLVMFGIPGASGLNMPTTAAGAFAIASGFAIYAASLFASIGHRLPK